MAAGTSTGGVEQLADGISQIHAGAAAGNIHAKRAAITASNEACERFAQMAGMLSRNMAEDNYGPEITEPLARASQHLQAAAMTFGEGGSALMTLMAMSVGELAQSPRQAPHHAELSENGSR